MGYKREQFVCEVEDSLICSICEKVLEDPHDCEERTHSFCKGCITERLSIEGKCPVDGILLQVDKLVRNRIIHNVVQNREVWCHTPDIDDGAEEPLEQKCEWKGKLQTLAKHRETCLFQQVRCPQKKCKETMQRREFKDHDKKCKYKRIECNECNEQIARFQLQDHINDECPETPIPCPNKCTAKRQEEIQKIRRADLDNHLNNICPKTVLDCEFKDQGCSFTAERKLVGKHLKGSRHEHMRLLAKQCSWLTEQCSSLTTENKRLRDQLYYLKEELHAERSSNYDWTVYDYPDLSKNHPNGSCIKSQTFWLRGRRWNIMLYPNGDNADAKGFLSLFLYRHEDKGCRNESEVPFGFTVLSQNPDTEHVSKKSKNFFTANLYLGWKKFMKACDALSPSYCSNGNLTIQCTIHPDKPQ